MARFFQGTAKTEVGIEPPSPELVPGLAWQRLELLVESSNFPTVLICA